MALIRDVLKKSDRGRQRGTAHGIPATPAAGKQHPRGEIRWSSLLVLALVLCTGLLMWWLQPWEPEKEAKKTEAPRKDERAAVSGTPARNIPADRLPGASQWGSPAEPKEARFKKPEPKPVSPGGAAPARPPAGRDSPSSRTASGPMKTEGAKSVREPPSLESEAAGAPGSRSFRPRQNAPGRSSLRDLAKKAPTNAGVEDTGPVTTARSLPPGGRTPDHTADRARRPLAAAPAPPPVKTGGEIAAVEPKPAQEKTKADPSKAKPQAVQPDGAGAESEPTRDKGSETEKGVLPLRDLPVDIQRELPDLSFSMLVFSRNPADRRIGINGKLKHEGDEVAAGLKVERITPTGAVLSFRGHRFHKDVL